MIDVKKLVKLEKLADELNGLCYELYKDKSLSHSQNFFLSNSAKQILKIVNELKEVKPDV